jgi:hypothetical protein
MPSRSAHHGITRTSRFTVAVVLALVVLAAFAAPASARIMLGAHVETPSGMTEVSAIKHFEREVGHKLPALRLYYQWDSQFPNADAAWAKSTHHRLFISFKAKTGTSSGYIQWRSIANARPGSALYKNMVRWADGIKRFGAPVLFSFQPEPESWSGDPNGGPGDFKAAWRKVWHVFRSRGVKNATWVWTMTGWAFRATDQQAAANWWPGGKYVDAIGSDVYNWWNCRNGNDGWDSLASDVEALRQFGLRHPTKDIYLPEFGSVEDRSTPGRKARWFEDLRASLKQHRYHQFKGIFYFHAKSTDSGVCDWKVDTSSSSLKSFSQLAGDRFYRR